jgi:adenylosuccinate lyase
MAAVRKGVGREQAHEAIKEHAVAVALEMRATGRGDNDLFARLAGDLRLGLSREELDGLVSEPLALTGAAQNQVRTISQRVAEIAALYPEAAMYVPGETL